MNLIVGKDNKIKDVIEESKFSELEYGKENI